MDHVGAGDQLRMDYILATSLQAAKRAKAPKGLRRERKALAGRYYQLLLRHAATGDYRCNKIHRLLDKCWQCAITIF